MPDNEGTPGQAPTGDGSAASLPQVPPVPALPAMQTPVNQAQASTPHTQQLSQQGQSGPVDVSAMIAQYEARIRNLMSEKDKALNERNQAINAQAQMQQSLTEYQTQSQATLTQTTNAAQLAIDQNNQLSARVQVLEAELQRANVVLQKPELAPYIQFIPAESDPEKLKSAVEQLEQVRQNDLQRSGVRQFPNATPPAGQSTLPTLPSQIPPGQQDPNLFALYGQRQNMAPVTQVGSSPAMMNPAGGQNVLGSIETMLKEAMASGDPAAFEKAVRDASSMATLDINRQLGR